jgi:branched-chain amino acid transport system ATP-binding protein
MTMTLQVDNIDSGYPDVPVLRCVSLEAHEGEIVAVVGTNGAGKTTLMLTLSGILKPTAGHIWFDGVSIGGMPAHQVTEKGLALVPEGGRLFPFMTVEENLELGAYAKRARSDSRARLAEVIEMFPNLKERRNNLAGSLSGGERQMCAIARAMMSRPRVLLLDEPSVGLSPLMAERVLDMVRVLADREKLTIILVEQRVREALDVAARAYVLDQGRIVRTGPAKDLGSDRQIQATYMGL